MTIHQLYNFSSCVVMLCFLSASSNLLSRSCVSKSWIFMCGTKSGASVKRYLISSSGRLAVSGTKAQKKMALEKLHTWKNAGQYGVYQIG